MKHRVIVQRLGLHDLDEAFQLAARNAPETAARWLERFHQALQTLDTRPERCPLAAESRKVDIELREYLFGRKPNVFRVVFTIDGDAVRILRIRRASRRFMSREELRDALDNPDTEDE